MLKILHEDAHFLAMDKPAGLATRSQNPREESLEMAVRAHLSPGGQQDAYIGVVHRLDRPVSGVILWAKNRKAASRLAGQFAAREARKEYTALVAPEVTEAAGIWDDHLYEGDTGLGRVQVCLAGTPRSRRAITRFRRDAEISVRSGCSLLRLMPETGRTHQLRVQSSSRSHPIVGDTLYGSPLAFGAGIALHASRLTVRHPITNESMTFEAALPASWRPWIGSRDGAGGASPQPTTLT